MLLSADEIRSIVTTALDAYNFNGKRVLVIIPDGTRTAPTPLMFRLLHKLLWGRVAALDYLIALGTHRPMDQDQINKLVGVEPNEWATTFSGVHVFNHLWENPETFITLGTITAEEMGEISDGKMRQPIEVRVNKLVHEYDQ